MMKYSSLNHLLTCNKQLTRYPCSVYFFLSLLVLSFNSYSQNTTFEHSGYTNSARQVTVGWEIWYPFQYRNHQADLVGVDFEILQAILDQTNFTANYIEIPWQRNLNAIKSGFIDIAMGASKTKERLKYSYFSEDYREEKIGLIVRKGQLSRIKLNDLSELQGSQYKIGVERGYYYGEQFQQLQTQPEFNKRLIEILDIEQGINLLLNSGVDGVLADPITIAAFEEKYQIFNMLEVHPLSIYQYKVHLMLSKKSFNKEELNRINSAINELKRSGKLQNIIDKHVILR